MIPDDRQDQAIAYLFGEFSPEQQGAFEGELQRDPELQRFVREMRETLGHLAQSTPQATPPPELKTRIMAMVREENDPVPVPKIEILGRTRRRAPVAWMAFSAVMFLIALGAAFEAWDSRARYAAQNNQLVAMKHDLDLLQGEIDSQRQQIAHLAKENTVAGMRVAKLDPQIPPLAKANAVVVWNAGAQQGLIKGDHLAGAGAGKDYQLWLIDPSTPSPVSAGVIAVSQDGSFAATFKPVHPVNSVAKFAISVEVSGGSDSPHGPIVFVGG